MCGICGLTLTSEDREIGERIVSSMVSTLEHRGPDGQAAWSNGKVALGHSRLSIIDIDCGSQPMTSPAGLTIVFNGEIYNYKEIRRDLSYKGRRFRTQSDTEVLLASYEEYGEDCLDRLVGMFAFVIYDERNNKLFFARDRVGKKPFYYVHNGAFFAFSSEIKALLKLPQVRREAEIDPQALVDYFSLGYVQTPKTIFHNIKKLDGGHAGTLDLGDGSLSIDRYWDLLSFYRDKDRGSDYAQRLLSLFEEGVRLRLRSDVPLGAFLSGGMDSSAVVASMCKQQTQTVRSFCVGFGNDWSYDESEYATLAARSFGSDLQVLNEPPATPETLSRIVWHLDEPFCDTSIIPTYLVSRAASRHVKVILSGDGADELFAGYPTHRADMLFKSWARLPLAMQTGMRDLANKFLKPSHKKVSFDYKVRQFLGAAGLSAERAHCHWRTIFSDTPLSPDVLQDAGNYSPFDRYSAHYDEAQGLSDMDRHLYVDMKTWLIDDILVKTDRMSMAHSLEVRSPFLDHRLVEYSSRLPHEKKIDLFDQKIALKKAVKEHMPSEILSRSKKGFNYPTMSIQMDWEQALADSGILKDGLFLDARREDITYKRFSLMVFGLWHAMFANYKKTGNWEPAHA